jgi:hypothetical protein
MVDDPAKSKKRLGDDPFDQGTTVVMLQFVSCGEYF